MTARKDPARPQKVGCKLNPVRAVLMAQFGLTYAQTRKVKNIKVLLDQLMHCADDEARRIILRTSAPMPAHPPVTWRASAAKPVVSATVAEMMRLAAKVWARRA